MYIYLVHQEKESDAEDRTLCCPSNTVIKSSRQKTKVSWSITKYKHKNADVPISRGRSTTVSHRGQALEVVHF